MLSHLARASLEGALLAGGVWLVCRALPRMSPGARALLWWCVAAKFVVALLWLTPIAVPVLPRASVSAAPSDVATGVEVAKGTAAPVLLSPETVGSRSGDVGRSAAPPAPRSGMPEIPWTAVLVGAWVLGVGASLLRTVRGWRRTRGVISRSRPADEGVRADVRELSRRLAIRRAVEVRVSAEVESPVVVGVRRPVILVPADGFAALSPDLRRMALCHEIAHLARGDLWLGCVPAAAERCFFFHPLARLAAREYAFWREAACDAVVLTTLGASPQSYGRMLLALGVSRRTATFSAAGAAWSFQNLKRRIIMLDRTSPLSSRGRALAACAVAAALLAIVPVRAVARSAASATPARTPSVAMTPVQALVTAGAPATPAAPAPNAATPEPAAPGVADTVEPRSPELPFVLYRADGNTIMSGRTEDMERARRHRRGNEALLWFRYDGGEYVVRDGGVLREAEEMWGPVGRIGEEQGRIGEQQGAIGEEQGRIGGEQGEIGARQGRLGERLGVIGSRLGTLAVRETGEISASERRAIEREREGLEVELRQLERQMEALGREMRELGDPMRGRGGEMEALGREMEVLSRRMDAAVARANTGMQALVRRAIDSGAATAVR